MPTTYEKDKWDGKFLWLLHSPPPADSFLNQSGNINIIATIRSGQRIDWDKPDSTWPNYNPDPYFYSEANAVKAGKRLADWFEYQGLTRDKGHVIVNGVAYAGAVYLQDWASPFFNGNEPDGTNCDVHMFYHPDDMVSDSYAGLTTSDFSGFSNAKEAAQWRYDSGLKHSVGYTTNSYNRATTNVVMTDPQGGTHNIMGISTWAKKVFESMKSECDARNLCYPRYYMGDTENYRPVLAHKMTGCEFIPNDRFTNPRTGFPALWKSSIFKALTADPRFTTETVYQEWNGGGWVNKTWANAWAEAGSPSGDANDVFSRSTNVYFGRLMTGYHEKIVDYAFEKFIFAPARSVFPGIKCGNSDVIFPLSGQKQFYENQNSWLKYPNSTQTFSNKRHLHSDFQSPHLFSPNITNATSVRYGEANYNSDYYTEEAAATPNNLFSLGHPFGATAGTIYKNFILSRVDSLMQNRNPSILDGAWFQSPSVNYTSSNTYFSYTPSVSEQVDLITECHKKGMTVYKLFNPFMNTWNRNDINDFESMFTQFKSFVDGYGVRGTMVDSEDGAGGLTTIMIDTPRVARIRIAGPGLLTSPQPG